MNLIRLVDFDVMASQFGQNAAISCINISEKKK